MSIQDDELLRSTASLIESEPTMLGLIRPSNPESDGEGGRVSVDPPSYLPPQKVFLSSRAVEGTSVPTEEGHQERVEYVLVGMPTDAHGLNALDVEEGDIFTYNGLDYKVYSVSHDRRYEVKANCRVVY